VRTRGLALAVGVVAVLAGCTSPEATRSREGGPGADPGNHRGVVEMHEGAEPYWRTPRLLGRHLTSTDAPRPGERGEGAAASPR
jgi:hypothetical protein